MALLFTDSFDHYVTADGLKKYNAFGTGVTIVAGAGRRSTAALNFSTSTRFANKTLPSTYETLIIGFAYKQSATGGTEFLYFLDGATVHVSLVRTVDGAVAAYRGASSVLLGTSANNVFPSGEFVYVEAKVKISDTVGTVEVRINGSSSPILNLTGLDTRNAGNAYMTGFNLRSLGTAQIDDLYVCDTSGSSSNDFLGDVRVDALFPTSDGTYSDFTPSTGTTHYVLVDETAPSATDYVDGSTAGNRDSYGFQNLSPLASSSIFAVQVSAAVQKDDAGSRTASVFARSSSTNSDGTTVGLSTSLTYLSHVFNADPNGGGAWTESSVNAAEFGVKVEA